MRSIIETPRLILRTWQPKDADSYYLINQDPLVVEFLYGRLTKEQVHDFIVLMNLRQNEYGYSLWATELKMTGELIGFIGINRADFVADFTPDIEIGWRLGSKFWGNGYATEGAKASLKYGFDEIGLEEIVSFTVPANKRSIRVMEKIGMQRDLDGDFSHPKVPIDHPLSNCVLYRIRSEECKQCK